MAEKKSSLYIMKDGRILMPPVNCDALHIRKSPKIKSRDFSIDKKELEMSFKIAANKDIDNLQKLLLEDAEKTVEHVYEKIYDFLQIFVEDYLCLDLDIFTKEYSKQHDMSLAWGSHGYIFLGFLIDGVLYNVGGLLLTWPDLTLVDPDKPMWANDSIMDKLKTLIEI